ncbi:MAG TPA: DUF3341 domain-containing protein [Rudaea sp.]|nr:DUF3341 domain-containing protein [Rudaea sp.]
MSILAEFASADALLNAACEARARGYDSLEAYSPTRIPGLDAALGLAAPRLPWFALAGGALGGFGMFGLECYAAIFDYPIDVGGRPLASWQAFVPPALETTLLGAVLFAVAGFLIAARMPRLHQAAFDVPRFADGYDRWFLLVRADGAVFDRDRALRFLRENGAREVSELPP